MAEAVNNLYKTESIRQHGPWRTVEHVELATLEWVWWWNNSRASTASSTCAPHSKSRTRTTLTTNQASRRPPDRKPDKNENQAYSFRSGRTILAGATSWQRR